MVNYRWRSGYTLFVLTTILGCGGKTSIVQSDIIGTWTVTRMTCNGSSVTSMYVPTGGSLTYTFDGSTMTQTRSSSSCTQTVSMPYTLSNNAGATVDGTIVNSAIVVAAASTYTINCTPSPCTQSALLPSAACGTTGTNMAQDTTLITSYNPTDLIMTTRNYDPQAAAICAGFGGMTPLTFSMNRPTR